MRAAFAVALLLAAASAAHAGLVATDSYSCDPATCKPPTCLCASNSPPGGLSPSQIPQFIILSHDNALNNNSLTLMMNVLGAKTQRNGCPVPVTWFAMRYHSDCYAGKQALARGDEVAMQANRFYPTMPFNSTDPNPHYNSRDPVTGLPSVEIEITMSRKWWHDECGMPMRDMVGYRSQGYYNNEPVRQTLSKNGYLYDATLPETWYPTSPTSPAADQELWPYSMDSGIPQNCGFLGDNVGSCTPGEKYKGLWELPLYEMQSVSNADLMYGVSNYGDTTTGSPAVPDMFQLFKSQLDARLAGGRSPLQISTFYEWLGNKPNPIPADDPLCIYCQRTPNANANALAKFIDYATTQPNVWFVTGSDLIHWMQDPVPANEFAAWWQCRTPGVKANLAGVNLSAADLVGANTSLTGPASPVVSSPPPAQAPSAAPAPTVAPSPAASPVAVPSAAPSPAPAAAAPSPAEATAGLDGSVQAAPSPVGVPTGGAARPAVLKYAAAGAAALVGALLLAL